MGGFFIANMPYFLVILLFMLSPDGLEPPGMALIPGSRNAFADKHEVTNAQWLEYANWVKQHPEETFYSYTDVLPDTAIWGSVYTASFAEQGHYKSYPVVGVNYPQVVGYLQWRSKTLSAMRGKKVVFELPSFQDYFNMAKEGTPQTAYGLFSTDFDHRRNFIGLCDNAAEMTAVEGFAIEGFKSNDCRDTLVFFKASDYLGFRCKAVIK